MATKVEAIHNLVKALGASDAKYSDEKTIAAAIQDLADAVEDGAISAGGGGSSDFLRCDITETEDEDGSSTVRISNAAKLVSALTYGSGYSPVVVPVFRAYDDAPKVLMLTVVNVEEGGASISFGPDSADMYFMVGIASGGSIMAVVKPDYETPVAVQVVDDELVFTVNEGGSD